MKTNLNLGLRLLELRQQYGLTQKQLCEQLHIARNSYSYFETGSRTPDLSTLLLIARFYNVSIDSLVNDNSISKTLDKSESIETITDVQIIHHLKSKHIPLESVLELRKADFDFLSDFKKLTSDNQAELRYIMSYKIRKQAE